ncbi:MAG TPA: peptide deformylase [Chitinispirillaceae bacterium]|nr:peptide deformylase [Chitinispirillaceae bacterium]
MAKIKSEPIIQFGDSNLRTVCSMVNVFHKGLHNKIDVLAGTLRKHGSGAALAAPQISLLKRIIVIDYLSEYYELINPVITEMSGETIDSEGCLSLPDYWGNVKRYKNISVDFQDRFGTQHTIEVKDQMARCFQHEIDHLDGILFIDRAVEEFVHNDKTNENISIKDLLDISNGVVRNVENGFIFP